MHARVGGSGIPVRTDGPRGERRAGTRGSVRRAPAAPLMPRVPREGMLFELHAVAAYNRTDVRIGSWNPPQRATSGWRTALNQTPPPRMERRRTRPVRVGGVTIGGEAPVSVQSMTKTHTYEAEATLAQIRQLASAS